MKCPHCDTEMQKGNAAFMSVQGFGQMIVSFTADTEKTKGFFARETKDKVICSGEETECYYCPYCSRIMPVFDLK